MKDTQNKHGEESGREKRLIEQLRKHPELMERLEAIVELAEAEGEKLLTADEVEGRLIEEVRRLGNQTMRDWAARAEKRVGKEMEASSGVRLRKKRPELVVRFWGSKGSRAHLAQRAEKLPAGFRATSWSEGPRQIRAPATCGDGLWSGACFACVLPADQGTLRI